jgi:ABC-type multidrug transport system fused ATPase/permease subunit
MLGQTVQRSRNAVSAWLASIRGTWEVILLTLRLAEGQRLFVFGYISLAIINAATESLSIMLIVPLLQSFSSDSIFSGVPVLDSVGQLLQPFSPEVRLRWVAVILLGIILVKSAVQYFTEVMIYILPLRLERDLRMRAFAAMMESRLAFAESISTGDIGNYTASFPARAGLALRFLIQGTAAAITILIMLALFIAITPSALMGLAGFVIIGSILFKRLTGPLATRLDREMTESQRDFTQAYFEAVNNKRTIRIFNATDTFLARINKLLERLRGVQTQTIAVQNATYPFFATLSGVLICGLVLMASFASPDQAQALLGVLLLFLVASARMLGPFSVAHIARMHFVIHSDPVRKMDFFLKEAARNRDTDGKTVLPKATQEIRFDHVTFEYSGSQAGVKDLDFRVRQGEFLAIVGPSGSGKSTIFHLISRLRRPDQGEISINGYSLNELKIRSWWNQLCIVSQDVPIFNATVRENIHFGRTEEPDDARIWDALENAVAADFVRRMPGGLDSPLGEFGSNLSGGERQRLALARAFYHRTPVILLDEVTSQLDAETEQLIAKSIMKLHNDNHTIIAIAHRPKTIRGADRVLVLREGRVVASGNHSSLLKENDFYREMAGQIEEAVN